MKRILLVVAASLVLFGCSPEPIEPQHRIQMEHELAESAFRAGANTAAKLIWENPDKYKTSLEVQDAAWEYAKPKLKYLANEKSQP